ncbi:iron-siderophore ABC transporter substrate-binding protein [Sciscionella marina]|uniref:iron-siderophore ABC transporter substrate-binding protein n=1 Tax=Sciscionella marina TaxID=508770 RepID=UPI001969CA00|nr:iron-siderophore ABC transporter substrate-binding protein [Sciscionella marina]
MHPKRVVTIGWGSQDAALALGVVPVGMPDFSSDSGTKDGILPWDKPLLKGKKPALLNTTSGHVPFEDIAKLHPDVILAVDSGLDKQQYAQLSNVAPTVAYPGKAWATSWQDQLSLVGKALGRSDKAEELRRTTEARIAKAAASHPEFRGKTVVFGSQLKAGTFNLYHADDARLKLLAALGFTVDPFVQNLAHTDGSTTFSTAISAEQLSSIKANVLIAWYPTTAVQRTAENQPGFAQLPAVRNKAYIPYTDPPFVFATSTANVLSLPWMLDRYLPKLSEAAKNARPAG